MRQAAAIANYYIGKGISEGQPLTHLKLQKLMYIAYGWYHALYGSQLFEEDLQAWKFGPVVASVYGALRHSRDEEIYDDVKVLENNDGHLEWITPELDIDNPGDKNVVEFLDTVWNLYSKYSAIQLTNYSHVPNGPWAALLERTGGLTKSQIIPKEDIASFFKRELDRLKSDAPGIADKLTEHVRSTTS